MPEKQKTILITGSNRGIGFELSRLSISMGYFVIMTGRSYTELEKAENRLNSENIFLQELDISKIQSVENAFENIKSRGLNIDILINNAGILPSSKNILEVGEEEIRTCLETNVLGSWRLIKTFYPLLIKSPDPRIINISSGMGALQNMGSTHFAYRISKTALNAITAIGHADLGDRLKIFSVCPGWVKTEMGGSHAPGDPAIAAEQVLWLAYSEEAESGYFYRNKKRINW